MAVVSCSSYSVRLLPPPGEWARIQRLAEEAQPIFEARDWHYGWRKHRVPSVEDLVSTIWWLYETVIRSPLPDAYSSTGRWTVKRLEDGTIDIQLEMDGP